jgi:hypothetical protein
VAQFGIGKWPNRESNVNYWLRLALRPHDNLACWRDTFATSASELLSKRSLDRCPDPSGLSRSAASSRAKYRVNIVPVPLFAPPTAQTSCLSPYLGVAVGLDRPTAAWSGPPSQQSGHPNCVSVPKFGSPQNRVCPHMWVLNTSRFWGLLSHLCWL